MDAHGVEGAWQLLNHDPEALWPHFDLSQSIAVFEDGQSVGGTFALLEMSIPGGTSVVAGVFNVEVQSSYTQRGIMAAYDTAPNRRHPRAR